MQDAALTLADDLPQLGAVDGEAVAPREHLGVERLAQLHPHGRQLCRIPDEQEAAALAAEDVGQEIIQEVARAEGAVFA